MSHWQKMRTAPQTGEKIWLLVPGYGPFLAQWVEGYVDDQWQTVGGWTSAEDNDSWPESWTEGVCWLSNADCEPSVQPVAWMQAEAGP